jgi:hypothetical protein
VISREEITNFAREALGLSRKADVTIAALGGRGSDRAFYRLTWNVAESAMLIHYEANRIENAYYGDIALFLDSINIPVPKLIYHDADRRLMVMEDLGDIDLWSLRNEPWELRQDLYQKTLTVVNRLHSFPLEKFLATEVRLMEPFDLQLYEWERSYFRENFVERVCHIEPETAYVQKIEDELSDLANHIHRGPTSLVHRDFQSQNVMIFHGETYLIDFQGMRLGSPFYDLASLLCDPYVQISWDGCDTLLSYYHELSHIDLTWPDFQQLFWKASVQRLMQALGAYGFLGLTKGLTAFLDHIPRGLGRLQHAASHVTTIPHLHELLTTCQTSIEAQRREQR